MEKSTSLSIGRARDLVLAARRILIGIAAYYIIMSLILLTGSGLLDETIFGLSVAIIFLAVALFSRQYPKVMFIVGTILCSLLVAASLFEFKIIGILVFTALTQRVYRGWEAAKYLDAQAPVVIEDENILDANL